MNYCIPDYLQPLELLLTPQVGGLAVYKVRTLKTARISRYSCLIGKLDFYEVLMLENGGTIYLSG